MSQIPSWKTSNQKRYFKNVKIDNLNYENGKWDNITDTTTKNGITKTVKKTVRNLDNQDIVVGINTEQPYSRLSLGDNSGTVRNSALLPSSNLLPATLAPNNAIPP